jgi:hypothetical protein
MVDPKPKTDTIGNGVTMKSLVALKDLPILKKGRLICCGFHQMERISRFSPKYHSFGIHLALQSSWSRMRGELICDAAVMICFALRGHNIERDKGTRPAVN